MAGYSPLYMKGSEAGLVQERQNFILPNDAFPVLENAYIWREQIKRKQGCELLGRLQRNLVTVVLVPAFTPGGPGVNTYNIILAAGISGEPNASLVTGNINPMILSFSIIGATLTDSTGTGVFVVTGGGGLISSAIINYSTGVATITVTGAFVSIITATFSYYPNLPVMGLRSRELNNINNEQLVAFDQIYAYIFNGTTFEEFLSNTASTWTGTDFDFFWSTNYWVGDGNQKIFWVTNFSGTGGDPIRYTNGASATNWIDFSPQIDASANLLTQCLAMLPFRGRLVSFNTFEGANLATSINYTNRIRWAAIGNPFTTVSAIVSAVNPNAWRDDIRGQGGFLDIPTSEAIVAVGFVRDNLVIYCERSTWQLRYTGRSIAPFQIEKVNSELGSESTFSAVQFDTSLVGIGDKGIVECDSFASKRIDIKIPDLVFDFNNINEGTTRVHGIRNFFRKLAYWVYPYAPDDQQTDGDQNYFPNKRLVYNYENDSWAIFDDSYTTLGTFQEQNSLTWADLDKPTDIWSNQNYPWIAKPALFPDIVGGNQQGYVETLDQEVENDESLYISNITSDNSTPDVIKSINHNLLTGAIIELSMNASLNYSQLDGLVFSVVRLTKDTFQLFEYDAVSDSFITPRTDPSAVYQGDGQIIVRDNFNITSKKFNFLDEGENIQMGYLDVLMDNTDDGAITLNVYVDYNDTNPVNTLPENINQVTQLPDLFFNSNVPTSVPVYRGSSKNMQRVYCPCRGTFLTIQWTLSNLQMIGSAQKSDVQIDAQILWIRKAGKLLNIGI